MTRKLALLLAAVALLCVSGAVQAGASAGVDRHPTGASATLTKLTAKSTKTYTAKQRYRDTKTGEVVTGIRTDTGQVFTGVDTVTETIDPTVVEYRTPTTASPNTAAAIVWRSMAKITDNATWNDPNSTWNYRLGLQATVGQQQTGGVYTWDGPYQFRQLVTCRRFADPGTNVTTQYPTSCALHLYDSSLEWRSTPSDFPYSAWGSKNWPGDVGSDFPLYGSWHRAFCNDFACMQPSDWVQSTTTEGVVTFEVPLHVSRTYNACSLLALMTGGSPSSATDPYGCTGLVAT
jgi:hypothetical protein